MQEVVPIIVHGGEQTATTTLQPVTAGPANGAGGAQFTIAVVFAAVATTEVGGPGLFGFTTTPAVTWATANPITHVSTQTTPTTRIRLIMDRLDSSP
jgi:hypothetical protein